MSLERIALVSVVLVLTACGETRHADQEPPGKPVNTKTSVLEAGANLLQSDAPLERMNIYLVGFHPMKNAPHQQMEAHHYCDQVNQDFAQCALFDGNTETANLTGIEYIISQRLFEKLPEEEKQYWHPHNFEILSGQLVAPGLPTFASNELMRGKINSYGKTWHMWNTRMAEGEGERMPLGEPQLAWSFNREGEVLPGLVESRDKAMGIDTSQVRQDRSGMVDMAEPQRGVDALKGAFEGKTSPIEGVEAKQSPDNAD